VIRHGRFADQWRGDGWMIAVGNWLLAIRWRWRFAFVRPPGKPGYTRLYVGPVEIEHRSPRTGAEARHG
jgi:hypothetical protein